MKCYILDELNLTPVEVPTPVTLVDGDYVKTARGLMHRAFIIPASRVKRLNDAIKVAYATKQAHDAAMTHLQYCVLPEVRILEGEEP